MSKKIVNTYQVSFAKSLDISKDYKSFDYDKFKKPIKTFSFKFSAEEFFLNEDFFQNRLEGFELDSEVIYSELSLKLEKFKKLKQKLYLKITFFNDKSIQVFLKEPKLTINFFNWKSHLASIKFKNWIKLKLLTTLEKTQNSPTALLNIYLGSFSSKLF